MKQSRHSPFWSGKLMFSVLLILLNTSLTSCSNLAPGSQTRRDATANIQTFVDANRSGKRDSGEAFLPDVLVAARSNIHGTMTFTAQLTDMEGETSIDTTYTHFFDLIAFPPCGYEATTPTSIEAKRKVAFGFAPIDPQPGLADFYILLWQDDNQDGQYQSGEIPIAGEILYIDPGLTWGSNYSPDIVTGQLSAQTDSGGEAAANLGNSCGQVTITIPQGWQPSTTNGENNWEDGEYHTTYQPGRTNIFLGVIPGE